MCNLCYMKSKPKQECVACKDLETIYAKNMCQDCYHLNRPEALCQKCGKIGPIQAKNMCRYVLKFLSNLVKFWFLVHAIRGIKKSSAKVPLESKERDKCRGEEFLKC